MSWSRAVNMTENCFLIWDDSNAGKLGLTYQMEWQLVVWYRHNVRTMSEL
jgi:hypothetical protein